MRPTTPIPALKCLFLHRATQTIPTAFSALSAALRENPFPFVASTQLNSVRPRRDPRSFLGGTAQRDVWTASEHRADLLSFVQISEIRVSALHIFDSVVNTSTLRVIRVISGHMFPTWRSFPRLSVQTRRFPLFDTSTNCAASHL